MKPIRWFAAKWLVWQDRCANCRHPLHLHIPVGRCHWQAVPRMGPSCDCPGYTTRASEEAAVR